MTIRNNRKRKEQEDTTTTQTTLTDWVVVKKQSSDKETDDVKEDTNNEDQTTTSTTTNNTSTNTNTDQDDAKQQLNDHEYIKQILDIKLDQFKHHREYKKGMFDDIAFNLMNNVVLVAGTSNYYRLSEIEFYVNGHKHLDTFTHGDQHQQLNCTWYFHRQNGGSYKTGTYKGLDITFGDGVAYAGILIRGIEKLEYTKATPPTMISTKIVDGPSLCVDELLKAAGPFDSIDSLVKAMNGTTSLLSNQNTVLSLKKAPGVGGSWDSKLVPISTGRVGLTMKMDRKGGEFYFAREYRYVRLADKIKKGKHYMNLALVRQGHADGSIRQLTNSTVASIKNIRENYESGLSKTKKDISKYKAASTNEECCILLGICSKIMDDNDKLDGSDDQDEEDSKEEKEEEEQGQEEEDDN